MRVLVRVIDDWVSEEAQGLQHEIEFDYRAVIEREGSWLRLVATRLAGLAPSAADAAWQEMLNEAGSTAIPSRSSASTRERLYPAQRFAPGFPTALISALVARTGRTRSADAPPPLQRDRCGERCGLPIAP